MFSQYLDMFSALFDETFVVAGFMRSKICLYFSQNIFSFFVLFYSCVFICFWVFVLGHKFPFFYSHFLICTEKRSKCAIDCVFQRFRWFFLAGWCGWYFNVSLIWTDNLWSWLNFFGGMRFFILISYFIENLCKVLFTNLLIF